MLIGNLKTYKIVIQKNFKKCVDKLKSWLYNNDIGKPPIKSKLNNKMKGIISLISGLTKYCERITQKWNRKGKKIIMERYIYLGGKAGTSKKGNPYFMVAIASEKFASVGVLPTTLFVEQDEYNELTTKLKTADYFNAHLYNGILKDYEIPKK